MGREKKSWDKKRARPRLESLEDRNLLATLLWDPAAGQTNFDWSVVGNWIDQATLSQASRIPQPGDNLLFTNANSTSSIDNLVLAPSQSFASLTVKSGFTGTITLDDTLTTQSLTFASNATLTGDAELMLNGAGTWSSGTMSGLGQTMVGPKATLLLEGSNQQTDPTLDGRTLVVAAAKGSSTSLAESKYQVQMTSGILFLQGTAAVQVNGSFLVKSNQDVLIGGFDDSTLADFKVEPGGLFRVDLPSQNTLHINARFDNSSAAGATQVMVSSGNMSLFQGGALSGKIQLGGAKTCITFDESGQDTQYDWQQGIQFTGKGMVLVKGEGAGPNEGSERYDAIINVEANEVDFGSTVQFDAWGGALVGPGVMRFTSGTSYLDGFLVWAADSSGTDAARIIINAAATVVFRGGRDSSGNFLSPAILRSAQVTVNGTLVFDGEVFTGYSAYGMPETTPSTDSDPLQMYLGSNVVVSFLKGSTLQVSGALAVQPFGATPSTAPKLLWQNGAKLIKVATGLVTTSTIGPGIIIPTFDANRQIIYQNGAGSLVVNWGLETTGVPSLGISDPPPTASTANFLFSGPLDTSTSVVSAQAGSNWTGSATVTAADVTNQGTLVPGGAGKVGVLAFDGDLTQGASGSVNIDLNGPSASGNYDQVQVTGYALLGGALNVSLNGYTPTLGDSYTILSLPGGYTGTFATAKLPALPAGYSFQLNYFPNSVVLTVVADPAAPSITGVSPSSGSTSGGQSVVITGSNFSGVKSVSFGGVPASKFTVNSNTQITAVAPPHAASPGVTMTVTTTKGSASKPFVYITGPLPVVTGLSDDDGYLAGGSSILIDGSHFTGATSVTFGSVPASVFQVLSDGQISVVVPPDVTPGLVDVSVANFTGTSLQSGADQYTYVQPPVPMVTALSQNVGASTGGSAVTITGTGFTSLYDVQFGGVSATSFTVESPTTIVAVAPPGVPGNVDVTVVTSAGGSSASSADLFDYFPANSPAVTGLSVTSGPTTGGEVVTLSGTNFSGASGVFFGTVSATSFTVSSENTITAVAPPEGPGVVDVTVKTASAASVDTLADQFTYFVPPIPMVSVVSQTTGATAGGSVVTITGSGFTGATNVYFGSDPASKFVVLSDNALIATAPAEAAGTVDVTVVNTGGTSADSVADQFTYQAPVPVVLSITPTSGPMSGGQSITLLGTGFTAATSVSFGTVAAESFTVLSDNVISAVAPAEAAGIVDIRVTTQGGRSAMSSNDRYTFTQPPPPVVTEVSPATGNTSGGSVIIIDGTNFTGAEQVYIGVVPATSFTVNSDSQITAVVPPEAPGMVDVTVATPEGVSSANPNDSFSYLPVIPAVTGVSPAAGPLAGSDTVTITGHGFLGTTAVSFGMTPATSFKVLSDSTLLAVVPAESASTVDVVVMTLAGQSSTSQADQYTFQSAPVVNFYYPFSDTTTGGVPITISGSGFLGTTAVLFGSMPAASFTVNSDSSLTVTTPANSVGNVSLIVVGPGGESSPLSFTYTAASTVTWIGGNGDWETAANWSDDLLPGPAADVVIPAGVTVTHSTGTDTIHRLTVDGTLALTGGMLDVNATGTIASLSVSGGSLGGTGALSVTGAFTWGGGSLEPSSSLTLEGATSLAGNVSLSGTILNFGSATANGDSTLSLLNGAWENEAESSFTANSNGSQQTVSGNGVFLNAGTFVKTGMAPTSFESGVSFDNTGTLTVSQGTLTLSGGSNSGSVVVAGGAQLSFTDSYTLTSSSSISGGGSVTAAAGTLTLGGTLSASGGLTIDQTATAAGQATINANVTNNGTISDGGIVGVLTINGNYIQSSTGALNVTLAIGNGGTVFDQIRISGQATLAGALNVNFTNGFAPPPGSVFPVLTWEAFSGGFSSVQPTVPPLLYQYNSDNFDLLSMLEQPRQDSADPSDSQSPRSAPAITLPDDDGPGAPRAVLVRADNISESDLVFTSITSDEPADPTAAAEDGDAVWEDASSIEDLLTLPFSLVESLVEAVV